MVAHGLGVPRGAGRRRAPRGALGALGSALGAAAPRRRRLGSRSSRARWSSGLALDLGVGGLQLPTIRRQVDERWRGAISGVGLGAHVRVPARARRHHVVTTSTVYVTWLAALLAGFGGRRRGHRVRLRPGSRRCRSSRSRACGRAGTAARCRPDLAAAARRAGAASDLSRPAHRSRRSRSSGSVDDDPLRGHGLAVVGPSTAGRRGSGCRTCRRRPRTIRSCGLRTSRSRSRGHLRRRRRRGLASRRGSSPRWRSSHRRLAGRGLYAPHGVPRVDVADLDPRAAPGQAPGRAGVQRFFSQQGRAFSLYVIAPPGPGLAEAMRRARDAARGYRWWSRDDRAGWVDRDRAALRGGALARASRCRARADAGWLRAGEEVDGARIAAGAGAPRRRASRRSHREPGWSIDDRRGPARSRPRSRGRGTSCSFADASLCGLRRGRCCRRSRARPPTASSPPWSSIGRAGDDRAGRLERTARRWWRARSEADR